MKVRMLAAGLLAAAAAATTAAPAHAILVCVDQNLGRSCDWYAGDHPAKCVLVVDDIPQVAPWLTNNPETVSWNCE